MIATLKARGINAISVEWVLKQVLLQKMHQVPIFGLSQRSMRESERKAHCVWALPHGIVILVHTLRVFGCL